MELGILLGLSLLCITIIDQTHSIAFHDNRRAPIRCDSVQPDSTNENSFLAVML
jgi:hypothetical protein